MSELLLPKGAFPSNLYFADDVKVEVIEGDMYDICNRIRREVEGGDRIDVIAMQTKGKSVFCLMERTDSGASELVFKVGPGYEIDALDGRVIEKLNRLLKEPLADRVRRFEKEEERQNALDRENELEELYERVGAPMMRQMHHDGFSDSFVSYPLKKKLAKA